MYPKNMPRDIEEFYNVWEGNAEQDTSDFSKDITTLDETGRRLVLFTPNEYPWADMVIALSYIARNDFSAIKSVDDIVEAIIFGYYGY